MIRDATIFDIPHLNELGTLLNPNFSTLYNLKEMLEDGYSKVIVYEKDNLIVGFITATHLYETCDILSLIVDPEFRRHHIATNLIGYLITDLGENLKLITLEVAKHNKAALKLYDKFGFKIIHERKDYYANDDAYLMARKSDLSE